MDDKDRRARIRVWGPLRKVFDDANQLFAEATHQRTTAEAALATKPLRGDPPPALSAAPPAAYARQRDELTQAIAAIKPALTDYIGQQQTHACTSAIVSFIDERERVSLGVLAEPWRLAPFQTTLLQIDDGGDRWFEVLHELLERPDVHELVFEIHLLCLRAGFVGRLRGHPAEIDKLTARIKQQLRLDQPRRTAEAAAGPAAGARQRRVGFIGFPVRYYLIAAAIVIVVFAGLRALSAEEVARSNLATDCLDRSGARS